MAEPYSIKIYTLYKVINLSRFDICIPFEVNTAKFDNPDYNYYLMVDNFFHPKNHF